jgi:hypothetical protein
MDFNKQIIKNALIKATTKFKSAKKIREYYWDCIESGGYSISKEIIPNIPNDQNYQNVQDFSEFLDSELSLTTCALCGIELNPGDVCGICDGYLPTKVGYNESKQLSLLNQNAQNTRTLIENKRLNKLNVWTSEEGSNRVYNIITEAVNSMKLPNEYSIVNTAMNIFGLIEEYYLTNKYSLKANSGSLRRGYIVLCIFYAIISLNNFKKIHEITPFVENASITDIPQALKNYNLIIMNNPNNQNPNNPNNLQNIICGVTIPDYLLDEYSRIYNKLIEDSIFKGTTAEKASLVYYLLKKNNLKINFSDFNCSDTSISSIRTNYNKLVNYLLII